MTYKYIEIKKIDLEERYVIYNTVYKKYIGEIRRERMGTWMHWQLFAYEEVGITNGCLKEISKFITTLYSKKKKDDIQD